VYFIRTEEKRSVAQAIRSLQGRSPRGFSSPVMADVARGRLSSVAVQRHYSRVVKAMDKARKLHLAFVDLERRAAALGLKPAEWQILVPQDTLVK
jgi:hypothetical protein